MFKDENLNCTNTFMSAFDSFQVAKTHGKIEYKQHTSHVESPKASCKYVFSKVEADRQSKEIEKQARLQRIKEVREQERLIAREGTGKQFREMLEQQKADEKQYLQYLEYIKQKQELEELKAQQIREIEAKRVNAELAAKLEENQRKGEQDRISARLIDRKLAEIRGQQAIIRERELNYQITNNENIKRNVDQKQKIKETESKLSRSLANNFREKEKERLLIETNKN